MHAHARSQCSVSHANKQQRLHNFPGAFQIWYFQQRPSHSGLSVGQLQLTQHLRAMHLTEAKSIHQGDFVKPSPVLPLGGSPPQSWLHSTPAQMPWGTKQPLLVRFTGGFEGGMMNNHIMPFCPGSPNLPSSHYFPLNPIAGPSHSQSTGLKRKMDIDDEAEMMSAVNKLHISESKLACHQAGFHPLNQQKAMEEEDAAPRLVLSDELKQLTAQDQLLLPKTLVDRMRTKDTMALVLWQPPKPRLIPRPEPEEEDDDGNNNNNNGESIDLNNMPTFSNILEPLDGLEVQDDVEMEAL